MKLIIYIILLVLASALVFSEGIDVKLIQYDPDTDLARIQIRNTFESKSLRNVSLIIDNGEPHFLVGILSSGNAVVHSRNIQSGMHKVTIIAGDNIIVSRELLFSKSAQQIRDETKAKETVEKKSEKENETQTPLIQPQVKEQPVQQKKVSKRGIILLAVLIFLALISAGIYWYLKLRHKKYIPRIQSRPLPIMPARYTTMTRSPEQIKRAFEQRARKRQEMFDNLIKK